MHWVYQLISEHPFLALVQSAFTIWMLIDLSRRHVEQYWFYVILFVQPIGAWIYFFAVAIRDMHGFNIRSLFQHRASLEELRYRAKETPTLANHVALAERLMDKREFAEAVPSLQSALNQEPDYTLPLYLLARCHIEMGHAEEALPLLERIVDRERQFQNYAAWRLLITTRAGLGQQAAATESCRALVKLVPTLEHRCFLADQLLEAGQVEEARTLLEQSLQDHHYAPAPIRGRNRRWAREARRLQKRCEQLAGTNGA